MYHVFLPVELKITNKAFFEQQAKEPKYLRNTTRSQEWSLFNFTAPIQLFSPEGKGSFSSPSESFHSPFQNTLETIYQNKPPQTG